MQKMNDSAFTGLEAAIVLIAFVVVAAVFSYVVLGAGFFTTQKSQETVYKGVEQATSNIQMIGQVYGLSTIDTGAGIDRINFTIGLAPGSPSIDLEKLTIMYSNETVAPKLYTHTTTTPTSTNFGTWTSSGKVTTMSAQDQVQVSFLLGTTGSDAAPKNTKISIELRPAVGASLPFTRQIPATVQKVNVLY